jgi:NitT/TauT family transport system substrate-binding protein
MPPDAPRTALRAVAQLQPALSADRLAVARTFTNDFVRRSKARYRA